MHYSPERPRRRLAPGSKVNVLDRVSAFIADSLRFRSLDKTRLSLLVLRWGVLYATLQAALLWSPHTRLGPGVAGILFPLLTLDAWLSARGRWRMRALQSIAAAIPTCSLVVIVKLTPGTCCVCDQDPPARALRDYEFIADVLYCIAIALVPACLLLLVLRPRSSADMKAYVLTSQVLVLVTLLMATAYGAGASLLFAIGS